MGVSHQRMWKMLTECSNFSCIRNTVAQDDTARMLCCLQEKNKMSQSNKMTGCEMKRWTEGDYV